MSSNFPGHDIASLLAAALEKHAAGDIVGATQLYRAILERQPDHADALHLLGVVARQKGNATLALRLIEAALSHHPDHAAAWSNRGLILQAQGRSEEALQSVKMAIATDAAMATAWNLAAVILRQMNRLDDAKAHHMQALRLEPGNQTFRADYAATLLASGEIMAAYRQLRDISEPHTPQDRGEALPPVLGNILQAAGHTDRALACFIRAAEQTPQAPGIYVNQALARLKLGDYLAGFRLWQTRQDGKDEFFQAIAKWQGEPTGHLLLYEDQGMGDALQCLRYLPLLKPLAAKITIQITAPLQRLIAENFPDIDVVTLEDPVPDADARVSLMSLPYRFKTELATIPKNIPYMRASANLRVEWSAQFDSLPRPRIGLVWGGNPGFPNDRNRSVPFDRLDGLIAVARRHLISFQLGRPQEQSACAHSGIYDAAPGLQDFAATAAALSEVDLLITVDTAIAHLAGALGRPVWLMLPFDPDWRWMLEREDNLWYPTVKLYRQMAPGDWQSVVTRVAEDARKFIAGDQTVLLPKAWQGPPAQRNSNALALDLP